MGEHFIVIGNGEIWGLAPNICGGAEDTVCPLMFRKHNVSCMVIVLVGIEDKISLPNMCRCNLRLFGT